jgi:hypothetical protein
MLLIIPTIQKIVRTAATGPANRNAGPPSGLAMKSIVIPAATAAAARTTWPSSCQRARRSRRSSIAPSAAAAAPPIRRADTSDGDSEIGTLIAFVRSLMTRNATATDRNAAEMASPPLLGIGTTLTRRSSG